MKTLTFQVLLALAGGERHGWSLVRELQERDGGDAILPGNFYRTLRAMAGEGLIEESAVRHRRTYFRLTKAGREAAQIEAQRLEALVAESRAKKLLSARGR